MAFAMASLSHAMRSLKKGSGTNTIDVKSFTLSRQKLQNARRAQRSGKIRQTLTAPNKQLSNVSRRHMRLIKIETHSAKRCRRMSEKLVKQNQKP